MAWEARLGLKHALLSIEISQGRRLNGLGSPFGIETRLDSAARMTDGIG